MDIKSFNTLAASLRPKLLAAVSQWQAQGALRGSETPDDIVQDTMLRLWIIRDRLDSYKSIESVAIVAARNIALDTLRKSDNQSKMSLDSVMEPADDVILPDAAADISLAETLASELLSKLPDRQALIVRMRHSDGLELSEIVALTGMSEGNVRTLLSRGRSRLRELYLSTISEHE